MGGYDCIGVTVKIIQSVLRLMYFFNYNIPLQQVNESTLTV